MQFSHTDSTLSLTPTESSLVLRHPCLNTEKTSPSYQEIRVSHFILKGATGPRWPTVHDEEHVTVAQLLTSTIPSLSRVPAGKLIRHNWLVPNIKIEKQLLSWAGFGIENHCSTTLEIRTWQEKKSFKTFLFLQQFPQSLMHYGCNLLILFRLYILC